MRKDDRGCGRERKRYEREVPATLTIGSKTSGGVCGRVVTSGQTTIDVFASGKNQMGTLGIFVEPQLPMTHVKLRFRWTIRQSGE